MAIISPPSSKHTTTTTTTSTFTNSNDATTKSTFNLSSSQLLASAQQFLEAFSSTSSPLSLLTHFSTTSPISLLHCPSTCPHPWTSLLRGPNAVRSYFDLLATHWTRSHLSVSPEFIHVDPATHTVTLTDASMRWTWRASGRSWTEHFTCILGFDEAAKIMRFEVRTDGEPGTCVMRAIDVDRKASARSAESEWTTTGMGMGTTKCNSTVDRDTGDYFRTPSTRWPIV